MTADIFLAFLSEQLFVIAMVIFVVSCHSKSLLVKPSRIQKDEKSYLSSVGSQMLDLDYYRLSGQRPKEAFDKIIKSYCGDICTSSVGIFEPFHQHPGPPFFMPHSTSSKHAYHTHTKKKESLKSNKLGF